MNERHISLESSLLAAARNARSVLRYTGRLHLTSQDGQLMTEDDDLQIGLGQRTFARLEQSEETAQEKVEEGPDHGGALSQMTV
jgi:hypothetical protein